MTTSPYAPRVIERRNDELHGTIAIPMDAVYGCSLHELGIYLNRQLADLYDELMAAFEEVRQ